MTEFLSLVEIVCLQPIPQVIRGLGLGLTAGGRIFFGPIHAANRQTMGLNHPPGERSGTMAHQIIDVEIRIYGSFRYRTTGPGRTGRSAPNRPRKEKAATEPSRRRKSGGYET